MIRGDDLYLSNIQQPDMEYIYSWFDDIEFLKYYDYVQPIPQTEEEVNKIFKEYEQNTESEVFAIKKINDNQIIGITGFVDIVKDNETATLFIGIGNKNLRGKGYGKESLELLLEYGFDIMKLHRIQLNVLEFNLTAISLYEKAGFKREGIYREFVLRNNKRYDLILYGLLKPEWEKNQKSSKI